MTEPNNLVLAGGTVVNPLDGSSQQADIAVTEGRVTAIGPSLPTSGSRVLDCRDHLVTPGLVDAHSHIFANVSKVGAPPEEAHLQRGVVAVADAGSVGASTFRAFRQYIVQPARLRILSLVNVSVLGLIDFRFGELVNPETLVPADAVEVCAANRDIVRGLKIRLSADVVGDLCLPLLQEAVKVGEEAGLPLMVHIGETAAPLGEILDILRPGDIVAHCYTGKEHGILDTDGKVLDGVRAARQRGVLFECAHGKSNFSYKVAGPAIEQGFLPDLVCSDTSYRNWNGPVFDLLTTMAKLVALGMGFDEVLERATVAPARFLGLWDEGYGRIELGGPAHLSVFSWLDAEEELPDASGNTMPVRRLEPRWTVVGGEVVEAVPWRGTVPSAS